MWKYILEFLDKSSRVINLNTVEPTGLGKRDLNGAVISLQGVICTVKYNLGLSHGDCNGEVFILVR